MVAEPRWPGMTPAEQVQRMTEAVLGALGPGGRTVWLPSPATEYRRRRDAKIRASRCLGRGVLAARWRLSVRQVSRILQEPTP